MSAFKLDFSKAITATKKSFRKQKEGLKTKKATRAGVTVVIKIIYAPKEAGKTKRNNPVKKVSVRVMELIDFTPKMARRDGNGRFQVKRLELQDAESKKYGFSVDEIPLEVGAQFDLEFKSFEGPLPEGLVTGNIIKVSSLAPKHHVYTSGDREGQKSMDMRTGDPRVFWSCSNNVIVREDYDDRQMVVRNLRERLPLWKCAFGATRPTRQVKQDDGSYETEFSSSRLAICFGGETKTETAKDGTELFVHNTGIISTDGAEFLAGQDKQYKTLGVMTTLYALYDESIWNPVSNTRDERRVYQETCVRIVTNDGVITKNFGLINPKIWEAIGPQFVRVLDCVMFVKDPYDKQMELIDSIQQFVESNELNDGGNEAARAAIDAGNGVQRGTVVTIEDLVLDFPKMIRDLGTQVSFEDMMRVTDGFNANKLDATAYNNSLDQNMTSEPYKLDTVCLSTFRKSIDAKAFANHEFFLVTPKKKWNKGSGKTGAEVIAEYEANDDPERDAEDRSFDPELCLFYAVHHRTSPEAHAALEGLEDMDLGEVVLEDPPAVKEEKPEHRQPVRDTTPEKEDVVEKTEKSTKKARGKKKAAKRKEAAMGFDDDDDE